MQICVLFSATEVLHNSLCINIHTNNALLCNRAVITSRQEAAARNRTIQPLAIPCRSLHRTNVHSCTHRRVPAAARPLPPQLQSPSQGPGTTCLARQPRVTLQGCHKHLSCSLKKKKKSCATRVPRAAGTTIKVPQHIPAAPAVSENRKERHATQSIGSGFRSFI